MLIFGHPRLPFEPLYHIDSIEAITTTPPNSTLLFDLTTANDDMVLHCRQNALPFALSVASVKDAIFAETLGARYIVLENTLARSVQKIAETYLFDAKILSRIEDEEEIEAMAYEGIDGVLLPEAVVKVVG